MNDELIRELLFDLGIAYKKKGDVSKAKEKWEKLIELYSSSEEVKSARKLLSSSGN